MTTTADYRMEDQRMEADEFSRAEEAAKFILAKLQPLAVPHIAVVLGSGLGDFADKLRESTAIPYEQIPFFPRSTVAGHAGRLVAGKLGDVALLVMQGRVHQYEGYSAKQVTFPVRVFGRMGVRALLLTNAAGGINPNYHKQALVALSDHINLQGSNPLSGPNDERFGPRFPSMNQTYNSALRRIAIDEARKHAIELHEGIYAALAGPSYETPAEIRYLRAIGADLVGMSTVAEAIVARHMGMAVLAISCVTNMAAGLAPGEINHQEVLEAAGRVRGKLHLLLEAVIPKINHYLHQAQSSQ